MYRSTSTSRPSIGRPPANTGCSASPVSVTGCSTAAHRGPPREELLQLDGDLHRRQHVADLDGDLVCEAARALLAGLHRDLLDPIALGARHVRRLARAEAPLLVILEGVVDRGVGDPLEAQRQALGGEPEVGGAEPLEEVADVPPAQRGCGRLTV